MTKNDLRDALIPQLFWSLQTLVGELTYGPLRTQLKRFDLRSVEALKNTCVGGFPDRYEQDVRNNVAAATRRKVKEQ